MAQTNQWTNHQKAHCEAILADVRYFLRCGLVAIARSRLEDWKFCYSRVPASTRRRWKCGR